MATKIQTLNAELRGLDIEALYGRVDELEAEYQRMRLDQVTKGLENPMEIRHLRRNIARVKTEISKRELAAC